MNSDKFEDRLSVHAAELLRTHAVLLRDSVRNRAFYNALSRTVAKGSAVLDIGSGSGVWAVAAAKMGARRVVAIDTDELMVGVVKMLAAEHNVSDRVEVIWGSSFDIELPKEFDLVVSETIGPVGFDENIVGVMIDARHRFLKEGGVLVPETVSLHAAAGKLKIDSERLPAGLPFEFRTFDRLNLYAPFVLKRSSDVRLVTKPLCLIETDLRTATAQPDLAKLPAEWDLEQSGGIDCLVVWVGSRLIRGVRLDTRRTTSWRPTIFRFDPIGPEYKHVAFELSLASGAGSLSVELSDGKATTISAYSATQAATQMVTSARSDGQVESRGGRIFLSRPGEADQVSLRPAGEDDRNFLFELYRQVRRSEVAQFGWADAEVEAFLRMQFDLRDRSYRIQVPDADHHVIRFDNKNAGSLIVERQEASIVLVDIALLPEYQGRHIASRLIRDLQAEVGDERSVKLFVDKSNTRAAAIYAKLGFTVQQETDLQYEMIWTRPSGKL